jgi:peptide methionine sulfoxide reductase MsrB
MEKIVKTEWSGANSFRDGLQVARKRRHETGGHLRRFQRSWHLQVCCGARRCLIRRQSSKAGTGWPCHSISPLILKWSEKQWTASLHEAHRCTATAATRHLGHVFQMGRNQRGCGIAPTGWSFELKSNLQDG